MLSTVQVELKEANAFVAHLHRHHKPCTGHRFSVGVGVRENRILEPRLCGVAICGRPVARLVSARTTIEVSRLCTDGTKHACSFLYSKAARIAKELGYKKIQTYILETEPGTSLLAAGWVLEAETDGGQWKHTDKQRKSKGLLTEAKARRTDQPTCRKQRWVKDLT